MSQNRETRTVQNPALLAVGARPDVLIWRQQVGTFRGFKDINRVIKVGVSGMADSMMVVRTVITPDMVGKAVGIAVAPEFKTAKGSQHEDQKNWQASFKRVGGIYELVRSPEQMVDLVGRVQRGEWD